MNTEQHAPSKKALAAFLIILIVSGLYLSSLYSYLLFHSLVEIFSVLVIFVIFVLAWNTRHLQDNHYVLFIGIASLFSGALELVHTFAYKGFGVFPSHDANLPTQLWIAFRYVFSLSFLIAPFFIARTLNVSRQFTIYMLVTSFLFVSIFTGIFPDCFIEGSGLTPFKIISEYVIILIFFASIGLLFLRRGAFDRGVLKLMIGSIMAAMAAELSFTKYVSVYGLSNLIGHMFMLLSVYFIYRAIIVTGLVEPSRLLFRNLKQSEEKISGLNYDLKRYVSELEAVNKELEAFSYSVSHDLRAPLRSIEGFSLALLEDYSDKLDANGRDYIERIRAGTERMDQLIGDLMNLSRITQAEMNRGKVNLSEMVKKIADSLRETHPERQAEFVIAESLFADGDTHLLNLVLENLIGNAWKFTAKAEKARIEFGATNIISHIGHIGPISSEGPIYFVRDNGVGFDMTYADKLFNPFQRFHKSEEFSGIGIGLATVKRIIERHGGKIWAESEPDKGATFYFTL